MIHHSNVTAANISMFKQDPSIFTQLVWCAINTCMCNNFPAFLWASKRAPRKSRNKWGWSLKEDFLNNLEYRRYPTVSNQWQTSTAELCEQYKRLSLIQKHLIMDEGRHLWKLFTVWGGRHVNRWPFPLSQWQSRVTLQNCWQQKIFLQQTDRAAVTHRESRHPLRYRQPCVCVCMCVCNCVLVWQVWINKRYVSRGETQTLRSKKGNDGGSALTTAVWVCRYKRHLKG